MAAPFTAPTALNLITAVGVQFYEGYESVYAGPEYTSYLDFVYPVDPAGDVIYTICSHPLKPMQEWLTERHLSSVDFKYTTTSVRAFADSMEIDVRDVRDDANPAKVQMYMETARRMGEAQAALWPSLVVESMIRAISQVWLPDGQKVLDLHNFNPDVSSLGTYRTYYANSSQGGSAAYPLTFANLYARLNGGYSFKAPTGLDYPIQYTHLLVPPSSTQTARRLLTFDRLEIAEMEGQTLASTSLGGDTLNKIKQQFGNCKATMVANMPAGTWALYDASTPAKRAIGLKKRQDIIWQQIAPGGPAGPFPTGAREGAVSQMVFEKNKSKYGPYAEGEAFFRNWWGIVFCDGNASPVTSLNIVSQVS